MVPFSPHQHLLSLVFFLIDVHVRGQLAVALICVSLMVSDVEHLFMHPLAICVSSLEKYLFKSPANCLIFFFFLAVEF